MIELNSKTQQDFLNREWVQKLLDAGVDMSDAKYCICKHIDSTGLKGDYVYLKEDEHNNCYTIDVIPTYTVSELLYKLHEYIYPEIEGVKYYGSLSFLKDAPFYIFYYRLWTDKTAETAFGKDNVKVAGPEDYIFAEYEYPIESLASLLIQCHKKDIGIVTKDTGNISDK